MPKKRPPIEIWAKNIRPAIWERDGKKCVRCGISVTLENCHIDHIQSGKLGTNQFKNLRTLCRRCHVLRADNRHQGMIANALKDGIIDSNWRDQVWKG
ncbi:MAG TPA: HNH endonuclease signature motif containing protein [Bacillales bacterium]|nr:HNH endonuclease signature motif containing protein [Bacillales bacterium]